MSELQIGKKKIGNGYPVYIIAEGCDNHMGDVEVAKEMCRQAKLAGADCIKFQHHLPDEEMLSDAVIAGKNNIPLYEFLKQHALTLKQHRELMEYCKKQRIVVEAYSPITHGEILNQPQIKAMADKYGVTVPQLCIRYVLQSGLIALPKTANPVHMQSNGEVDFEISPEDMETLKHFKKIENYGASSGFPVYGGKI